MLAASVSLMLGGCAALVPPAEPAKPLDVVNPKYGYRFSNLQTGPNNSDGLFMVVAFSGGGTRSISGPQDQSWSLRGQRHATDVDSYLDCSPETGRPWIHLIDGGISDNLRLWGPLESSLARGGFAPLLKRMGVGHVRKVVFLVVSADVLPESGIDQSGEPPSIRLMASRVLDTLMNNISFETQTWLRSSFHYWREEARDLAGTAESPYEGVPDFYLIEASLREIADPTERKTMMAIPTTFKLAPEQVQALERAGQTLLENAPEFKRLVKDLQ